MDVIEVDRRKRLGSGLADQSEVISERKQVTGPFSFSRRVVVQQVADDTLNTRGVGRFEPRDQVVLPLAQVRAVRAD